MVRVKLSSLVNFETHLHLQEFIKDIDDVEVVFKLSDALRERGLTQKQFAELLNIRKARVSEICTGKRKNIDVVSLGITMLFLSITDLRDIIDIELTPEGRAHLDKCRKEWIRTKEIPEYVQDLVLRFMEK